MDTFESVPLFEVPPPPPTSSSNPSQKQRPDYESLWREERDTRERLERKLDELSLQSELFKRVESATRTKFNTISNSILEELEAQKRLSMHPTDADVLIGNVRRIVKRELSYPSDLQNIITNLLAENEKLRREGQAVTHKHSSVVTSFRIEWNKKRGEHYDEVDNCRETIKGLQKSLQSVSKARRALGRVKKWKGSLMYIREGMFSIRQELYKFNQFLTGSGYGSGDCGGHPLHPDSDDATENSTMLGNEINANGDLLQADVLGLPAPKFNGVLGVVASAFEGLAMLQMSAERANSLLAASFASVEAAAKAAVVDATAALDIPNSRSVSEHRSLNGRSVSSRQQLISRSESPVSTTRMPSGKVSSASRLSMAASRRRASTLKGGPTTGVSTSDDLGRLEQSVDDFGPFDDADRHSLSVTRHSKSDAFLSRGSTHGSDPTVRGTAIEGHIMELLRTIKGLREVNAELHEEIDILQASGGAVMRHGSRAQSVVSGGGGGSMRRSDTGNSIRKGIKSSGGLHQESSRSASRSIISRKSVVKTPSTTTSMLLTEHKKESIVAISGKNDEESSSSPRAKSFNGRRKSRVALRSSVDFFAGEEFDNAVYLAPSRNMEGTPSPIAPRDRSSGACGNAKKGIVSAEGQHAIEACRLGQASTVPLDQQVYRPKAVVAVSCQTDPEFVPPPPPTRVSKGVQNDMPTPTTSQHQLPPPHVEKRDTAVGTDDHTHAEFLKLMGDVGVDVTDENIARQSRLSPIVLMHPVPIRHGLKTSAETGTAPTTTSADLPSGYNNSNADDVNDKPTIQHHQLGNFKRIPSLSEMLPNTEDIDAYPAVLPSPTPSQRDRNSSPDLTLADGEEQHPQLSLAINAYPFLTKRLVFKIWLKRSVRARAESLFQTLETAGVAQHVVRSYRPSSANTTNKRPTSASSTKTIPTVSMHVASYQKGGTGWSPELGSTSRRPSSEAPHFPSSRPWSASSRTDPLMAVGVSTGVPNSRPGSRPSTAVHRTGLATGHVNNAPRPYSAQSRVTRVVSSLGGTPRKPIRLSLGDDDDDGFVQDDAEPTPRGGYHNYNTSPTNRVAQGTPRALVRQQRGQGIGIIGGILTNGSGGNRNDNLPDLDELEAFHDAYSRRAL